MTLQEQYNLIKEGKGHKGIFLIEAKKQFPNMLTNPMGFEEASKMLKTRGVISENYVDLKPINTIEASPKAAWENKFAQFLAEEAKAVEKKPTAEVEEIESHNYDYEDQTNLDNQIGQEVLNGLYFEGRENPDKTLDELRKMVAKNLAKDGQYYMKNAAFGVKGLGYQQTEVEEVAGKYAASGYSDKLKKMVKESLSESKSSDLAKMGYSASDIEDFMDEWKNGGNKLPEKVKDYLDGLYNTAKGTLQTQWMRKESLVKEEEFPTTPVEKLPFVSADKLRKVLQVVDKINVQVGPMSSTEVKNEADLVRVLMAELRFKQVRPGVYLLQGPNDSKVTMGKGSLDEASDFEDKMAQLRMLQMQKKTGEAPNQKVINKKQTLTQKLNMLKKAYFDLISAMEKETDLEFAVSGDWYQEQIDDLENSIGDLETKIQSINENVEMVGMEEAEVEKAEPKAAKKAVKKESLDSELAEIDTQAGIVAMEAKLDKISEMISTKMERLSMIEEDANLSELVDKGKMKAMQKEIKVLEKVKAKMEKMYEKMNGKAYTKEMVDESSFDNE
jgi:hypothetical protein